MQSNRRMRFRKGLHPLYLPVYDALCKELGPEWQPFFGLRSFDEQARLYAQGRISEGEIVTNSKPGESAHNYGCASDWTFWINSRPVWDKKNVKWREYENACDKVGAEWLGRIGDYPHNQLKLKIAYRDLSLAYAKDGLRAANEVIQENLA